MEMGEIIHRILEVITGLGYWGILIGLAIEVIPSEIVLAYAGYLVYQGEINLVEAVVFGLIGCLLQQILLYAIGLYGGRPFVDKYGKYLHIKSKHIDLTERWFKKYGAGVVFTSRFIPVVRQAISIPAGIARMNMAKFLIYTGLASIPWSILFVVLGKKLGENWESIDEKAGPYTQPILYAALALIVLFILYKFLVRKKKPAAEAVIEGQEAASRPLQALGNEYRVLNGRQVRSSSASQVFELLVVGPNGIFHIDSKNWGGTITLSPTGAERSKEGHQEDPTGQLYRHEYVLKELLREQHLQADVVGILLFTNPDCTVEGKSPGFLTAKPDTLVQSIKGYQPKRRLTADEIVHIAKLLEDAGSSSHS